VADHAIGRSCGHLVAQLEGLEMQVDDQKCRDIPAEANVATKHPHSRTQTGLRPRLKRRSNYSVIVLTLTALATRQIRRRDGHHSLQHGAVFVAGQGSRRRNRPRHKNQKSFPRETTGENTMAKAHNDRARTGACGSRNPENTAGGTFVVSLALPPKDADDKGGDNTTTDAPY
jgi:hypothetical protein